MSELRGSVKKNLQKAVDFLTEMIRYPSLSGKDEEEVQGYIAGMLDPFGTVEMVPVPESIKKDPFFTFADWELDYRRRKNVVLRWPSKGGGRSLILNSHADVVPATNWPDAFTPKIENNFVIGRGACDCKGHLATLYLVLLALKDLGIRLKGDLQVQSVIEEEVGGNGSLALIRQGYKADAVIVLESTELKIMPANRGAIWFTLDVEGKSIHMGKIRQGVNAIEKTCFLMKRLREYEKRLVEESRNVPLFEEYEQPVQVNFGTIQGDGWPAMVCGKVRMEGGVGFLHNKDLETIKREVREVIETCGDPWIKDHYILSFPKLHNDAYGTDRNHPVVLALEEAATGSDLAPKVTGFIVSCDARLFNKAGGMPTVVFGPGRIDDAHSVTERLDIAQMEKAAEVVARTVIAWCGKE